MASELRDEGIVVHYGLVDIRNLDGDGLLEGGGLEDSLIAILARLRDHKEAVRSILRRIVKLPSVQRRDALTQLLVTAGLRPRMVSFVKKEAKRCRLRWIFGTTRS